MLVEGESEARFVGQVLNTHLAGRHVLQPILTETRRGMRSGGLARDYAVFRRQLQRLIAQHGRRPEVWFGCMLDLYGLPESFPGREGTGGDGWARAERIEAALAADMAHSRFLPYLNVHELEALLLAQPAALAGFFAGERAALEKLSAEVAAFASPEQINLHRDTSPSHRIARHLPGYTVAKVQASSLAFTRIPVPVIAARCPHFAAWIERIAALPEY